MDKEIEIIVNSQNSEFKGIKNNIKAFDEIVKEFKEINNIKESI